MTDANKYWVALWFPAEARLDLSFRDWVSAEEARGVAAEIVTITFAGYPASFRNNVGQWLKNTGAVPLISNSVAYLVEMLEHAEHLRRWDEQARRHEACRAGACQCRLAADYCSGKPRHHRYFDGF